MLEKIARVRVRYNLDRFVSTKKKEKIRTIKLFNQGKYTEETCLMQDTGVQHVWGE